ncbi:MAG: signal recognition particle-docking protein FtsY [Deltaproteobacteria bacterium]|nr:signal recognition particle-docking protein FtsY [Deltaproteobacteria bacterium]
MKQQANFWLTSLFSNPGADGLLIILLIIAFLLVVVLGVVALRMRKRFFSTASTITLTKAVSDLNFRLSEFMNRANNADFKLSQELKAVANQVAHIEDYLLDQQVDDRNMATRKINISHLRNLLDLDNIGVKKEEEIKVVEEATVSGGLRTTRSRIVVGIRNILGLTKGLNFEFYDKLEELMLAADFGTATTSWLIDKVKEDALHLDVVDENAVLDILKHSVRDILISSNKAEIHLDVNAKAPTILLMVGINGAGKTTTIGKIASHYAMNGIKIMLAAADTFRAAAVEQLEVWGKKGGVEVVTGPQGSKPSTVVYDAIVKLKKENFQLLIVDTAGRLHTRTNLMNELEALVNMVRKEMPGAILETILVVDGANGQNAIQQARDFHKAVRLSGIIITKLDGTPKGGVVVAIKKELAIPIRYIGVGEGIRDLKVFDADEFTESLFIERDPVFLYKEEAI